MTTAGRHRAVPSSERSLIDELVATAWDRWADWHARPAQQALAPLIVAGGPAHRRRLLVVLFEGARPQVFAKVALDAREDGFVRREARALAAARAELPAAVAARGPEPLGQAETQGRTVAFARVVHGRRVADPSLRWARSPTWRAYDRFLGEAFAWSAELATGGDGASRHAASGRIAASDLRDTVAAFAGEFAASSREREALEGFAEEVGRTGLDVAPAWQHGDLAPSNSLWDGQRYRFLDWEHAGSSWEPWTDLASAPVAVLAMGRRHLGGRIETLVERLLSGHHVAGAVLRRRVEEHWEFPLPVAWAFALTCVRRAMLRVEDGRAAEPWATVGRLVVADERTRRAVPWLAPCW